MKQEYVYIVLRNLQYIMLSVCLHWQHHLLYNAQFNCVNNKIMKKKLIIAKRQKHSSNKASVIKQFMIVISNLCFNNLITINILSENIQFRSRNNFKTTNQTCYDWKL